MYSNSNLPIISRLQTYKSYPADMRLYRLACRGAAVQPVQAAAPAADKGESKCRPGSNRQARMSAGLMYTLSTHILIDTIHKSYTDFTTYI